MSFFSMFRSQISNIIKQLENIKIDLIKTQYDIKQLVDIEAKYEEENSETIRSEKLIKEAINGFGIAMWLKDINGLFLYVNQVCCDTILHCTEQEALGLRNGDLKNDALSAVCMISDKQIMESLTTRRFIEHAVYADCECVVVDVIKSPAYDGDKLIGVIGNAVNITDSIPDCIKEQCRVSCSIEIPINKTMGSKTFIELLEHRTESNYQ